MLLDSKNKESEKSRNIRQRRGKSFNIRCMGIYLKKKERETKLDLKSC